MKILKLQWDESTRQYKVNQPDDQSGEYVPLAEVERLQAANARLAEALRKLLNAYTQEDTFALMTPVRIEQVKQQAVTTAEQAIAEGEAE